MKDFFRRLMAGRYGNDALSSAILVLALIFFLLQWLLKYFVFGIVSLILILICYFRIFSRNPTARYRENQQFLQIWYSIKEQLAQKKKQLDDRKTHRYFTCPNCKKKLRVPRGKGKIKITCPLCNTQFEKKT